MSMQLRRPLSFAIAVFTLLSCSLPVQAEESASAIPTCDTGPVLKGKARQRVDSVALMTVAGILEAQGEADFHLKYSSPARECLVESFTASDATIVATYNPLEKGDSTLNYRFKVDRPTDDTEILVLYSGMAGLVSGGGYVVHVSEERHPRSWPYAGRLARRKARLSRTTARDLSSAPSNNACPCHPGASAPQARETIVRLRRAGRAQRGPLNANVRRQQDIDAVGPEFALFCHVTEVHHRPWH